MNPVTHFLTGWAIANTVPSLQRRDRALITLASVVPDIDGLGIVPELLTRHSAHPLDWFSLYHHRLHNLAFAIVVTAVALVLANRTWLTCAMAFTSFHIHLFEDVIGARGPDGYQWPIPYLRPFSHAAAITWSHQWALNAWPNFAITSALLLVTLYLAWSRGFSPLEMISGRADSVFVQTLRARFPRMKTDNFTGASGY
jgi:inner membrane protein